MKSNYLFCIGVLSAVLSIGAIAASPAQAQFQVRVGYNAGVINNINEGEAALTNPGATISAFSSFSVINFGPGGIGGGSNFPDGRSGTDDFVLEALGRLTFNTAGAYVFRVTSDDGFRLRTGVDAMGAGGATYSEFFGQRASGSTDGAVFAALSGSLLDTRLTYFERGGGEDVELSYSLEGGAFQIVGSTSDITVSAIPAATVPEAGTVGLMLTGCAGMLGVMIRRRGAKK